MMYIGPWVGPGVSYEDLIYVTFMFRLKSTLKFFDCLYLCYYNQLPILNGSLNLLALHMRWII